MIVISYLDNTLRVCHCAACQDEAAIAAAFEALQSGFSPTLRCSLRSFWRYCERHFAYVKAAGGVVSDAEGNLLAIKHYGHYDLPKGMHETGETMKSTALREVAEECGLVGHTLQRLLCKTYHIHNRYGAWQLKQTSWYTMAVESTAPPLTPQTDEDISLAAWLPAAEWREAMQGSYSTMQQVCIAMTL